MELYHIYLGEYETLHPNSPFRVLCSKESTEIIEDNEGAIYLQGHLRLPDDFFEVNRVRVCPLCIDNVTPIELLAAATL